MILCTPTFAQNCILRPTNKNRHAVYISCTIANLFYRYLPGSKTWSCDTNC